MTLGVRANHIEVADVPGAQLVMEAQTIEQLGGETYVYGTAAGGSSMTLHLAGQAAIGCGDIIGLNVETAKVQVFDRDSGLSLWR